MASQNINSPLAKNYFFIKSKWHGLVLDLEGGRLMPGTPVITWDKKLVGHDNQLWYEEPRTMTIRNKATGHVLDLMPGDTLVCNPHMPNRREQQFSVTGEVIHWVHNKNKCVDIAGAARQKGAKVCLWPFNNAPNQKWEFLIDHKAGPPPTVAGATRPF